jgi:type III secretion system TyeA family effector delivery regulator
VSQIDFGGNPRYSPVIDSGDGNTSSPLKGSSRQVIPASSPLQSEQQQVNAASLMETMESMSLVMGARLRQNAGRSKSASDSSSQLQEMLLRWVPKVEGEKLASLVTQFSMLGAGQGDPIAQMQQGGVPDGAMILLLASLLKDSRLEHKRRRRLEDALDLLLKDESILVDVFSWLELNESDRRNLLPLRQLYQRTRQDDDQNPQGMAAWFSEVKEWPDRRARLRILIRAMAIDLKRDSDDQPVRIVNAIGELKRLLLFFSLEDHCSSVAWSVGVPAEHMLAEILLLLEQSWIYPDWIATRMAMMNLPHDLQFVWLRRMLELLRFIPTPCFQDEEQCDQLIEAFTQLQDQLDIQET